MIEIRELILKAVVAPVDPTPQKQSLQGEVLLRESDIQKCLDKVMER